MENGYSGLEAAFMPTLDISYRITDITKPEATMPFLKHLAKHYKFNIQSEWEDFMGITPKVRLENSKQKFEYYLTQAETITGTPRSLFMSKSRKREYVAIRHTLMYICDKNGVGNLRVIGELFNGQDHSSVIHAKKTVEELIETKDISFMPVYNSLKHLIEK
jgi:hypothetical protein